MKKKYVVYKVFNYMDDKFCLLLYKKKHSECTEKEEAIKIAKELSNKGYNAEIVETWGK